MVYELSEIDDSIAVKSALGLPPVFVSPTALLKWKKAIGRMQGGEAYRPQLAMIGDSKTAGVASSFTGQWRFASSVSVRLAQALTARGLPASSESMFGSTGTSVVPASEYDPCRSGFSGWSLAYGAGSDGGMAGELVTTTGTNPGTFTPSVPVDRVRVFFKQGEANATTASAAVSVDGGSSLGTLAGGSSPAYLRSSVINLGALASHAISVTPAGGAPFYLAGMIAFNSTVPAVDVLNLGVSGVKAAYHATTPRLNWLGAAQPDLTIINLGSNDMLLTGATDVMTWSTSMQTIIAKAKQTGDVVLVFPAIGRNPASSAQSVLVTDTIRAPFRAALMGLAVTNGCAFVDEQAALGGRDLAEARGFFADSLHENYAGTVVRSFGLAEMIMV